MPDEFDEILDLAPLTQDVATGQAAAMPAPRLVARLYAAAGMPLRARLLACLMRPLGPLAMAGVAAGAFAGFLHRRDAASVTIDLEGAARVSTAQVLELARFVEQVDPQALQHFAGLVSGSPLGLATFSSAVLVLLYRALQAAPSAPTR
ncbi:MAG: hypothetical protein ACRC2B_05850 [Rubrivivax sp.]